jgi:hypothetical protein
VDHRTDLQRFNNEDASMDKRFGDTKCCDGMDGIREPSVDLCVYARLLIMTLVMAQRRAHTVCQSRWTNNPLTPTRLLLAQCKGWGETR